MHTIKIGLKETSNGKQKKTFKCEKEDGRPGKGREGKGREGSAHSKPDPIKMIIILTGLVQTK